MVYVKSDGTVVEHTPFSFFGWIWNGFNFVYLLFQTLINPNYNKHGDKYTRDFRPPGSGFQTLINPNYNKHGDKYTRDFRPPGSGPPKPPSRKFGGFGPSSSGPSPPPMGGCGCG